MTSIAPDHATLAVDGGNEDVACDYLFVFAGGEPPYPLLRQAGVGFEADHAEAAG